MHRQAMSTYFGPAFRGIGESDVSIRFQMLRHSEINGHLPKEQTHSNRSVSGLAKETEGGGVCALNSSKIYFKWETNTTQPTSPQKRNVDQYSRFAGRSLFRHLHLHLHLHNRNGRRGRSRSSSTVRSRTVLVVPSSTGSTNHWSNNQWLATSKHVGCNRLAQSRYVDAHSVPHNRCSKHAQLHSAY